MLARHLHGGTFGSRVADANGRATGFDFLRIALAISVVIVHSALAAHGTWALQIIWNGPAYGLASAVLPAFFILSGFLVAGSLERTPRLSAFLGLRAIRIVPALAVEVLLCAILLGPLLTTYTLAEYVSHPDFRDYFLNILGIIHYELPGVFQGNALPGVVNVSLWTVPYELEAYLLLAALALLGFIRRRWILLGLIIAFSVIEIVLVVWTGEVLDVGPPRGRLLILSFIWGVVFYRFRDSIPFRLPLALLAAGGAVGAFMNPYTAMFGLPLAAYATVYVGVLQIPRIPVLSSGDYSYGLYLFAFPIQQLHALAFPHSNWIENSIFGLTCGLMYAAFSWHCVEKPILQRRMFLLAVLETAVEEAKTILRGLPYANTLEYALKSTLGAVAATPSNLDNARNGRR